MDSGEVVQSQEVVQQAPVSQPVEKTFSQSEVNDLIGREKRGAVESYRRQQDQKQQDTQRMDSLGSHQDRNQNTFSESDFRRLASEEAQRLRDEWVKDAQTKSDETNAKRIVNDFWSKVDAGKSKYEDFDAVTGDMDLRSFPSVIQILADHIDNSSDVLYAMGKDRLKLNHIESLAERSPHNAIVEVKRLSDSIKANAESQSVRVAREPLSQTRPSNLGMEGGEVLSVGDYRRKYRV